MLWYLEKSIPYISVGITSATRITLVNVFAAYRLSLRASCDEYTAASSVNRFGWVAVSQGPELQLHLLRGRLDEVY